MKKKFKRNVEWDLDGPTRQYVFIQIGMIIFGVYLAFFKGMLLECAIVILSPVILGLIASFRREITYDEI